MKAIRVEQFGEPDVMKYVELPKPQPGPRQVLVRIHAAGVNPVDTYIRSGTYARKPALPYIPGSDAAGSVEAVGDDVTEFKTGDRVYTAGTVTGAYAEYAVCEETQVHPLPGDITFAQGAAIGVPYATAYRALIDRAQSLPEETVLIHGASGGVGIAAIQIARAHGLRVFATAGTEEGRKLVTAQGAEAVFDHRSKGYLDQVRAAVGGQGFDIILEMAANVNLANDLTLLAPYGRVIVVGSRGRIEIDPRDLMSRDADIRGMVLFNAQPDELAIVHASLVSGLDAGTLRPVVGREIPLSSAPSAHREITQAGARGKIVLIP